MLKIESATPNFESTVDSNKLLVDTTIVKDGSVIHVGENKFPPLAYELPQEITGILLIFLCAFAGFVCYMWWNYQNKVGRDQAAGKTSEKWSWSIWWPDNRINVVLFVIGFGFTYWAGGTMHPLTAFMIGLSPQPLIDAAKKRLGITT